MILLTVGGQLPFDRLIGIGDTLARSCAEPFVAQIGKSELRPANMRFQQFWSKAELQQLANDSRVIIGHAGIGTIITAVEAGKPLIIMARRASLGEHRNDHQLATIRAFSAVEGVYAAHDAQDVASLLGQDLSAIDLGQSTARTQLLTYLSAAIDRRLKR